MTRRKYPARTTSEDTRRAVLAAVLAAGMDGVPMRDICRIIGRTEATVQRHLVALSDAGRIERNLSAGPSVRWGPPGFAQHYARVWPQQRPDLAAWRAKYSAEAKRPLRPDSPRRFALDALGTVRVRSVWDLAHVGAL